MLKVRYVKWCRNNINGVGRITSLLPFHTRIKNKGDLEYEFNGRNIEADLKVKTAY